MLGSKLVRFAGLLLSADIWRLFGAAHPFGEHFRGYIDILPETLTREQLDRAIAAVPEQMLEITLWGTPDQVVSKLRAYGEAGLRHVVPFIVSPAISPEAAQFTSEALPAMTRALTSGE
jgi:phthiodiolone/phenolphthiodiolone dimycocerosates ketoreductase